MICSRTHCPSASVPVAHGRGSRSPRSVLKIRSGTAFRPRQTQQLRCSVEPASIGANDPVSSNLFGTKWPWQFMSQKAGTTDSASDPKLLMAIKLMHYFTLVAQGGVTWTILEAGRYLTEQHFPAVAVFLLALGSVYQAMAGAFFIMAHEYDGWQIAHFKWPDATSAPNPAKFDNDRLRLVSYQLLFWFQGIGMGMGAVAVLMAKLNAPAAAAVTTTATASSTAAGGQYPAFLLQFAQWSTHALLPLASWVSSGPGLAIALILFYVATPWFPTMYGPSLFKNGSGKALLVPRNTLIGFILLATCYMAGLCTIINPFAAVAAVLLFTLGALAEGLVSESIFDQYSHLIAVTVISLGCVTLIAALSAASGVAPLWANAEVRKFLGVLLLAAAGLISISTQAS